MVLKWRKISCSINELNLPVVLTTGQTFRWHEKDDDIYRGVLAGYVWSLKQSDGELLYYVHNEPKQKMTNGAKRLKVEEVSVNYEKILTDYFQLDIKLHELYSKWISADSNFKKLAKKFPGFRILRQDPVENLMSFICSSNIDIPGITSLVKTLCSHYGEEICEVDGEKFYSFPKIEKLADDSVETELRALSFGYRAKFIHQSAKYILDNHSEEWLESLRKVSYEEARSALIKLPGVGDKVADSICLMSLDKSNAIPVDAYVRKITVRKYKPQLKTPKTLTIKIYQQIGDLYREKFGEYAGWAITILCTACLEQFKAARSKSDDSD